MQKLSLKVLLRFLSVYSNWNLGNLMNIKNTGAAFSLIIDLDHNRFFGGRVEVESEVAGFLMG